jgi:hypothetical protein
MAETRPGTTQLESYLRDRGVKFTVIEHRRTETAAAEARAAHLPAEQTAKTVVLRTPDGYRFAVIPASERLDAHKASAALELGSHELRLATEQEMAAVFPQYELGAIPPFRAAHTRGADRPQAARLRPRSLPRRHPRPLAARGPRGHREPNPRAQLRPAARSTGGHTHPSSATVAHSTHIGSVRWPPLGASRSRRRAGHRLQRDCRFAAQPATADLL